MTMAISLDGCWTHEETEMTRFKVTLLEGEDVDCAGSVYEVRVVETMEDAKKERDYWACHGDGWWRDAFIDEVDA